MIWLLVASARSAEPLPPIPPRPTPTLAVPGECVEAIGLDIGDPFPDVLIYEGRVACTAVALPPSRASDALSTLSWADALEARYKLDRVYLEGQLRVVELERDWYKTRLEEAEKQSLWSRPWMQRTVGGASVLAVVGVTAWGLHQVE